MVMCVVSGMLAVENCFRPIRPNCFEDKRSHDELPIRPTRKIDDIRATKTSLWARPARRSVRTLRIRGLQHYYGEGELRKQVLFENNLEVYDGEIVIMTGPSGSGKTTLLTLIGTLRTVQEGSLQGARARAARRARSRSWSPRGRTSASSFRPTTCSARSPPCRTSHGDGAVPLHPSRDPTSGPPNCSRGWAWAIACTTSPASLSGGQKQRVAIARGLVHGPRSCWPTSRPPRSTSNRAARS